MTAAQIDELKRLLAKGTKAPWNLCAHLRKAHCGCGGNRGFIYGNGEGDEGHILDIFHEEDRGPDEEGGFFDGLQLPSRDRALANAALIVSAINTLPELLAAAEERDRLKRDIHRLIAGGKGICPCGCLNAPF